jgi:hypothetical protein
MKGGWMSKHLYSLPSDRIPVSICPGDDDEDFINNNVDIDLDNDGITNCTRIVWKSKY